MAPSRRTLLAGALACAVPGAARPAAADGLQAAAAAKGLAYGSAVPIGRFRGDARYRGLLARECGILVCDNGMKMDSAMPQEGSTDFRAADETADFARAEGQRLRGHCLVWHEALPAWAQARLADGSRREAEALMRRWIGTVAGRYAGRIEAWDVVNEGLAPADGRADALRLTPWLKAIGPRYVDLAFALQHEADPAAAGVWNENDVEQGASWMEERRAASLRLFERLRRRNVPIRRVGLQSHLYSTVRLDEGRLRAYLRALADLGLAIEITELDIDDRAFPADRAVRDRGVADLARRYLDVVLDEPAVLNVLTWDLYDPDTWLDAAPLRRRPDGLPQRPLPFDADYARKPLWYALRDAFRAAPDHAAARMRLRSGRAPVDPPAPGAPTRSGQ